MHKYGCDGIKTGETPSAGLCLAASFKTANHHLIIVILKTNSIEDRFSETLNIYNWINRMFN